MQCAIFALIGVIVGELMILLARGELKPFGKRKADKAVEVVKLDEAKIKSEAELMQQWQNLLSYGGEKDIRG